MARRRRQRQMLAPPPKAYRLHFFYEPLGRYFRSSKRRLYWSFGLTDMDAVHNGKSGNDCRGEEHEVELVWSLKSGKTRIYWNRRNISNLFRQDPESESVHISWETRNGEVLQIIAHKDATPGRAQYDLLIDGMSFYRMPNAVELGKKEYLVADTTMDHSMDSSEHKDQYDDSVSSLEEDAEESYTPPHEPSATVNNSQGSQLDSNCSDLDSFHGPTDYNPLDIYDGLGYRLSMVGLNSNLPEVDELHSEVYSPMLESLRRRIVQSLPQTEEMVSRSIIQTFFPDYVSQQSEDILCAISTSSEEQEPQQIEVDALFEAYEWAGLNDGQHPLMTRPKAVGVRDRTWSAPASHGRPRINSDNNEDELGYMQKLIDSIFIKVRNEDISSDEGARILLGVAAVLRLEFTSALPTDTLILDNLDPSVTVQDLRDALGVFGDLEAVAISTRCPAFGFCRFMREDSFPRLHQADVAGEFFLAGGIRPRIIALTEKMRDTSISDKKKSDEAGVTSPVSPTPAPGSFSTIPHLMGVWTDEEEAPAVVTPEHHHSRNVVAQPMNSNYNSSPRSTISMDFEEVAQPAACH